MALCGEHGAPQAFSIIRAAPAGTQALIFTRPRGFRHQYSYMLGWGLEGYTYSLAKEGNVASPMLLGKGKLGEVLCRSLSLVATPNRNVRLYVCVRAGHVQALGFPTKCTGCSQGLTHLSQKWLHL